MRYDVRKYDKTNYFMQISIYNILHVLCYFSLQFLVSVFLCGFLQQPPSPILIEENSEQQKRHQRSNIANYCIVWEFRFKAMFFRSKKYWRTNNVIEWEINKDQIGKVKNDYINCPIPFKKPFKLFPEILFVGILFHLVSHYMQCRGCHNWQYILQDTNIWLSYLTV